MGTGSGRNKEAEAAVPGDHSTSLAANKAVAGPEEGMAVEPGHEAVEPGHEVCGMGEVDRRVGQGSQALTVAHAAYSMVLVGEDEMDSEILVEAANLKPLADAQMGMDHYFCDPENSDLTSVVAHLQSFLGTGYSSSSQNHCTAASHS